MAQIVIRNLEEAVKARLTQRAIQNGRSLESEIRQILSDAASREFGLGTRMAARFAKIGLTEDLPELHGQIANATDLRR